MSDKTPLERESDRRACAEYAAQSLTERIMLTGEARLSSSRSEAIQRTAARRAVSAGSPDARPFAAAILKQTATRQ